MAFLDYLGILRCKDGRKLSNVDRVSRIADDLKSLALELEIAVVVACQINRQTEGGDPKPKLGYLRGSGRIEENADVAMLLFSQCAVNPVLFTDGI